MNRRLRTESAFAEQLGWVYSEGIGQLVQRTEGDVFLAALDRPDVGAVQPRSRTQFLLGPAAPATQASNGRGDDLAGAGGDHARMMSAC